MSVKRKNHVQFLLALGVALIAHVLWLSIPLQSSSTKQAISKRTVLEVALQHSPVFEKQQEKQTQVEAEEQTKPPPLEQDEVPQPTPISQLPEPSAPQRESAPLNLERFPQWDKRFDPKPADAPVFRPQLAAGLKKRQQQKRRQQLLSLGTSLSQALNIDEYNAIDGTLDGHLKTAQGCFNKKDAIEGKIIGLTGIEKSWEMTGCKEVENSPWFKPELEFDAFHRVVE